MAFVDGNGSVSLSLQYAGGFSVLPAYRSNGNLYSGCIPEMEVPDTHGSVLSAGSGICVTVSDVELRSVARQCGMK